MRKEETIDFHIKWTWHAISRMYNVYAGQNDMTMSIGYVLLNIDLEEGTPATKIGPLIGMEPRSLTRMLKALERKGWIRRVADEKDKRFVNVYLTDLGKKKRNFAREGVIVFNKMIEEAIPAEKLITFIEVIEKIKEVVEERMLDTKAILAQLNQIDEKNNV